MDHDMQLLICRCLSRTTGHAPGPGLTGKPVRGCRTSPRLESGVSKPGRHQRPPSAIWKPHRSRPSTPRVEGILACRADPSHSPPRYVSRRFSNTPTLPCGLGTAPSPPHREPARPTMPYQLLKQQNVLAF